MRVEGSVDSNNNPSNKFNSDDIQADLEGTRAALSLVQERLDMLERQVKARGTRDVARQAANAARSVPAPTLAQTIEARLRERPMELRDVAEVVGVTLSQAAAELGKMRQSKKVWNVGTATAARWIWRVGDMAPPDVLRAMVETLISDQPMTTAELVAATGARAPRVSGVLVEIQRSQHQVMNLGTPRRGRWFMIPATAKQAKLAPKAVKK